MSKERQFALLKDYQLLKRELPDLKKSFRLTVDGIGTGGVLSGFHKLISQALSDGVDVSEACLVLVHSSQIVYA